MSLGLALLEPSNHENVHDIEFDGELTMEYLAICCAFNRKGSLLAVGCNDGHIVVWDYLTRIVARDFYAHATHPVTTIDWSRDGRKLVSSSVDNTIAIWSVETAECLIRWTFPSPILKAQFNPRNDRLVLVCPIRHAPILVQVDYNSKAVKYKILPTDKVAADPNITASFDGRGQYIYTGNARGKIAIIKCPQFSKPKTPDFRSPKSGISTTQSPDPFNDEEDIIGSTELEIISSFKIQSTSSAAPGIIELQFSTRNKELFLANCVDRFIRLYDCKSALEAGVDGNREEVRKFQDSVEKTLFQKCCFSADTSASYVCAGSSLQHSFILFETETGTIKKTAGEAGKLLDIQWHPLRPIVVCVINNRIKIYARPQIENWSAFAPEFQELEENLEYDEKESEFDLEDEDNCPVTNQKEMIDETEEVDVMSVQPISELISSDEEDIDCLDYVPISLDDQEMNEIHTVETAHLAPLVDNSPSFNDDTKPKGPKKTSKKKSDEGSTKRIRFSDKSNGPKKASRQS